MNINSKFSRMVRPRRVLVVTAYPTNECQFFGPLIVRMSADKGCQIYLLSLSREIQEDTEAMWHCCSSLGIPEGNVTLLKSDRLPKDAEMRWQEKDSSEVILYQVECLDIDIIVTFDSRGVNGRCSHQSVFFAVAHLYFKRVLPPSCRIFVLETVRQSQRHLGILDVPLSAAQSFYFVASTEQRKRIIKAIRQHSKLIQIYGPYFRYNSVNTVREINTEDMVLEPCFS